jgi:murein DD-endopeptidase
MNSQAHVKNSNFFITLAVALSMVFSFILAPVNSKAAVTATPQKEIVQIAKDLVGKPYRYGGNTIKGFDASGFVQFVYSHSTLKIKLPRTSSDQFKKGISVKENKLQSGDLVFFKTTGKKVSFVGIYIGGNKFVASTSKGVTVNSLSNKYWKDRYAGAKRILK